MHILLGNISLLFLHGVGSTEAHSGLRVFQYFDCLISWRVGSNADVATQPQVKHFNGYTGLSNSRTWLHGNQEWETSTIRRPVFLLSQPDVIYRRRDTTGVQISSSCSAPFGREVSCEVAGTWSRVSVNWYYWVVSYFTTGSWECVRDIVSWKLKTPGNDAISISWYVWTDLFHIVADNFLIFINLHCDYCLSLSVMLSDSYWNLLFSNRFSLWIVLFFWRVLRPFIPRGLATFASMAWRSLRVQLFPFQGLWFL
jgi:hypothetical protein